MTIENSETDNFKQYKCKIAFDMGKTGIISFSGYIHFDESNEDAIEHNAAQLSKLLVKTEQVFKAMNNNVKLASEVKSKDEKV